MRLATLSFALMALASLALIGCKSTRGTMDEGALSGGGTGPGQPVYTRGEPIDADFYDQR